MNKVIMMGRLTRDPEVKGYTNAQGQAGSIARISIAVDRRGRRDGETEADFFNCTAFGKLAEFAEKYLKKGTKVVLEGSLQNNNYTDKDGVKHYADQIVVQSIEFAESKAASGNGNSATPASVDAAVPSDDFMSIPEGLDDELPFA